MGGWRTWDVNDMRPQDKVQGRACNPSIALLSFRCRVERESLGSLKDFSTLPQSLRVARKYLDSSAEAPD